MVNLLMFVWQFKFCKIKKINILNMILKIVHIIFDNYDKNGTLFKFKIISKKFLIQF